MIVKFDKIKLVIPRQNIRTHSNITKYPNIYNYKGNSNYELYNKSDNSMILDKTQKIINKVNQVSDDEQNNIFIRMNMNKYKTQYYVGENKIDKFLQNMKLKNSEQLNKKINKLNLRNKILRPYSSRNQKTQITNTNISENKKELSLINNSLIQNNKINDIQTTDKSLIFTRRKSSSFFLSDFNLSNIQSSSFRKSNLRRNSKKKKKNGSKNVIYKIKETRRRSIIKRGSLSPMKKMNSLPSRQFKLREINSTDKEKSNKDSSSEIKSNERRRSNPENRNSISSIFLNDNKSTKKKYGFKRKFGSFYEKIKIKKVKSIDNEFMNFDNNIKYKGNNIDDKVNDEVDPVQKKFLQKQIANVQSKIIDIQKNKTNVYKNCLYKKIKDFYTDLNKKIKINQEFNTFEGKEKTLKTIFKSFFFKIDNIQLKTFIYIVYKLIYSKKAKRRILRSFYTIAFRFLMDKYLNPRKGMLTLIFRFGIERKSIITRPTRKLNNMKINKVSLYNKNATKRNFVLHYPTYNKTEYNTINNTFGNTRYNSNNNTYYNTSNNSYHNSSNTSNNISHHNTSNNSNNNSYYNISNNSNNNNIIGKYNLVTNFNTNYTLKDPNLTYLVRKINNNVTLEKSSIEKENLIKIRILLEKSKQHIQNKFYVNNFRLHDTIFDILRSKIFIPKQKKYLKFFIKEKTKKPSVVRTSLKKGYNNNVFSTKKNILDQILKQRTRRKRIKTIRKKFRNDIQISNNLFSTSNQEITKIKTELLRALKLKGIENNLYKVIFYHIQEDNFVLVKKVINDNYGFINMNYKDEKGNTFLNIAVKFNCKKEIVQFLLINGCNPNIGNVNNIFFNFL